MNEIAELKKRIGTAIFDPGATEGYKGERTLTEWQVDAVMRILSERVINGALAQAEEALRMISAEAKESNEPMGRSVFKALATCGEIADLALQSSFSSPPSASNDGEEK